MKHFLMLLYSIFLGTFLVASPVYASPNIFLRAARSTALPKPQVHSLEIIRQPYRPGKYKLQLELDRTYPQTPLPRSVFRANPHDYDTSFTGTIFKGTHQGKEETFAAVATHTLHVINDNGIIDDEGPHSLGKHISANVFDEEGNGIPIELEVVKVGATPMVDVSLLKVLPEYEDQVNALELNLQDISEDIMFSIQGFLQKPFLFMNRLENLHIAKTSPLSLRALIPGLKFEINGMCGGAAVDEEGNLLGIFVGYVDDLEGNPEPKIGYVAPAKFLQMLINDYYQEPEGTFPLEIDGQRIIDLQPEEFISFITLRDDNYDILKVEHGSFKFSYRKMAELLDTYPTTRFIELEIGKMEWSKKNPEYLDMFEEHRIVEYDFLEQRLVRDTILF